MNCDGEYVWHRRVIVVFRVFGLDLNNQRQTRRKVIKKLARSLQVGQVTLLCHFIEVIRDASFV